MKRMVVLLFGVALSVAVMFMGCAMTESIVVPVTKPAEINLKGVKKIAVGEIGGYMGEDIGEEITNALFVSDRFPDVLDRENLNSILREQGLSWSGITTSEESAKLGEVIGATALVVGRVSDNDYKEERKQRTFQRTTYTKPKRTYNVTEYTRTGVATLTANLKVIDVQTGKILATKKYEASYTITTKKEEGTPPGIDEEDLYEACRGNIVSQFMKSIAPYTIRVEMKFQRDKEIPEIELGINMAKIGNWDNAITNFQNAVNNHPDSWKTHFNLALAYECCEEYDKAIEGFTTAYAMNPTTSIQNKIGYCRQHKTDKEKLERQLNQ